MTSIGFWGPLTQWVDEPTRDFPQMVGPNRWLPGPVAIQECHAYKSKPQGDPSRACTSKLFMFPGMHAFVHVCMYVFSWCEHTHSTIDTYTKSHAYIVVAYTYIEIYIYILYVCICMYVLFVMFSSPIWRSTFARWVFAVALGTLPPNWEWVRTLFPWCFMGRKIGWWFFATPRNSRERDQISVRMGEKKNWFSSTTKQKIRHFSCGQGSKLWSTFGCWWFLPYWGSDHFVPCPCAGCETNNRSGEITRHHGICEQLVTDSSIISSASKNHDISPLDYINAWKENTKQFPSISASETLGQLVA